MSRLGLYDGSATIDIAGAKSIVVAISKGIGKGSAAALQRSTTRRLPNVAISRRSPWRPWRLVGVDGMCRQRYCELRREVEHPNNQYVFVVLCLSSHNVCPGCDELNSDDHKEDGSEGDTCCDPGPCG
ncbi:hypothetical protein TIFTF001_004944 [Ficus carica]|uniref:Uncharacterized protein n=1 Tax=Ficus carica TaxID=3494 RepID=A0AA87ZME7_FICCA|nr:hypothetical protein TIFTF001_004944 [Ficus carica]